MTLEHKRGPQLSPLARALRATGRLGLALMGATAWHTGVLAQPQPQALDRVEVIGVTPLPGQEIDRAKLPYATQLIRRARIDEAQSVTQVDYLNRRVPGVQVNDIQGSPFQGDLTYRGFRASPLLGAGQGLSVFLDGVRVNEPFGDVINFDLIPEFAVSSIALVPGANPAFGLNSLGGALSYFTFDGRSAPGVRGEVTAGSFGRKRLDLSYGRSSESGWHQYIAATGFDERGWRDESAGTLGHVFAKIGHESGDTGWSLGLLAGRSKLIGNGLVPAYTLEGGELDEDLYFHRREAVYTFPDQTENQLGQLAFNLRHGIDADSSLSALAYVRRTRRDTINGDEAEEAPAAEGDPNAAFNTTQTRQTGHGLGLVYARTSGAHQWQLGASVDRSRVHYRQLERAGFFTPSRGVVPDENDEAELSAEVEGKSTHWGLYATDTWQVAPRTHVTGTARFNRSTVSNQLTTRDDDTGEIENHPDERFTYRSVNPAIGIAHRLGEAQNTPVVFANVARNTRVPTVIELGCADPQEPCRLPAGLQADPYLEQVKSNTVELGMRWPFAQNARLNVEAYRTVNRNDILFRSVSVNGQLGYFANFPKTRNQGVDVEFAIGHGAVEFGVGYSYLEATYQADGVIRQGERNVSIAPGTRIAGLPRHQLKLAADWRPGHGFSLGTDVQLIGKRGVAGNEDGLLADPQDGAELQARPLSLPRYTIMNLRAAWKPASQWELFASVANVFDRRYETFGALAETQFGPTGVYTGEASDALFVAPGTPRTFSVGLRVRF